LHLAAKFVPSSARTGPAFRTSRQQAPRKLEQEALATLRELRDELRATELIRFEWRRTTHHGRTFDVTSRVT
jgi:hypothetical protein